MNGSSELNLIATSPGDNSGRTASMTSAASVTAGTATSQVAGAGSTPSAALQLTGLYRPKDLVVGPIPPAVAKQVCGEWHCRHSYPGGSLLNFGAFAGDHLVGVCVLGVGPANLHRLFQGAQGHQVVCLSRFWLSDSCGRNSESRVLSVILRHLRQQQSTVKAIIAYSDPSQNHRGTIYKAAGLLFLGRSEAMPFYSVAGAQPVHSRTLSQRAGTHSTVFFAAHGVPVEVVPQQPKLTYAALVDPSWRARLTRPVLPYFKEGSGHGDS